MNSDIAEAQDTKLCPLCAETIKATAIRCKHCHGNLKEPDRLGELTKAFKAVIPGLGQIYNKQVKSGVGMIVLVAAVFVLTCCACTAKFSWDAFWILFSIIAGPAYVLGVWDAIRCNGQSHRRFVVALRCGYMIFTGISIYAFCWTWCRGETSRLDDLDASLNEEVIGNRITGAKLTKQEIADEKMLQEMKANPNFDPLADLRDPYAALREPPAVSEDAAIGSIEPVSDPAPSPLPRLAGSPMARGAGVESAPSPIAVAHGGGGAPGFAPMPKVGGISGSGFSAPVLISSADGTAANLAPDRATDRLPMQADVDFSAFLPDLERRIKKHWFPPKGNEYRVIVVGFKVHDGGQMSDLCVVESPGIQIADNAAVKAVEDAAPFRPLPTGSPESIDVQCRFDYDRLNGGVRAELVR
jgi:TonB family protein